MEELQEKLRTLEKINEEQIEKHDLATRKLNARNKEQAEDIRRLRKREEERKVKEIEEKTETKKKIEDLRDTLKERNLRIDELKGETSKLRNNQKKDGKLAGKGKSTGAINDKSFEKQKRELDAAKEEIEKLTTKLKESERRYKELQEEEDRLLEAADDCTNDGAQSKSNQGEAVKKELVKCRRLIKKKDREMEMVKEEKNNAIQEKLEHVRTIRNLNDSLDLMKRITIDLERANVSQAICTKTKGPVYDLKEKDKAKVVEVSDEEEDDLYDLLDQRGYEDNKEWGQEESKENESRCPLEIESIPRSGERSGGDEDSGEQRSVADKEKNNRDTKRGKYERKNKEDGYDKENTKQRTD